MSISGNEVGSVTYRVWKREDRGTAHSGWVKTEHTIEAKNDGEARDKMRMRFLNSSYYLGALEARREGERL